MKKLFLLIALPLSVLTAALLLAFANKPNTPVSFSITASVNSNTNTGTFTSTGLVMSSGSFIENYAFNGKKTHSEVIFTYSTGTVTAKTHSDIIITSSSTASGTGTWKILKGTGAYEKIKGSGTLTLNVTNISTPGESITEAWSGTIN